jgi:putative tryptophan/tyrosine transport system substrate-binding protein
VKVVPRPWLVARSVIFFVLCAMLFALCTFAEAQQPKKVPVVGFLISSDPVAASVGTEAIRLALRELGYIEGKNIVTQYRYAEGKLEKAPEFAAELVRLKVDVIVVTGGTLRWVRAAMDATKIIPIIMTGAGADPVEAGIVKSLAHPGGNVTGITNLAMEIVGKQLEIFKEVIPKLAHLAVLYDPISPGNVFRTKEVLPGAARRSGLTIRYWGARSTDDLEHAFSGLRKERPDGLYLSPSPLMNANETRTASFAIKSRLPSIYGRRVAVDAGGLLSYAADLAHSSRRVAIYIDKIVKGAKPADLPVEQPTKFELAINLKTAKQIGLTIPPNVLARADRVIR